MKTISTGASGASQRRLWGPIWADVGSVERRELLGPAMTAYIEIRSNGGEDDRPPGDFPGDGNYSDWIEDTAKRDGDYRYRYITYTEGPKDREWMEECDRNYVFRLLREGTLEKKEPRLAKEVPSLFAEIEEARSILAEESEFVSRSSEYWHAFCSTLIEDDCTAHSINLNTLPDEIIDQYRLIRQVHLPEKEQIIERLSPPKALEACPVPILIDALMRNTSVKNINFIGINLNSHLDLLVNLFKSRKDFQQLDLSQTNFDKDARTKIISLLVCNPCLTTIKMDDNPGLEDAETRFLQKLVGRNERLQAKSQTNTNFNLYHLAAMENDIITLQGLLKHKFEEINTRCSTGKTALDYATEHGNLDAVLLLLKAKAPSGVAAAASELVQGNLQALLFKAAQENWQDVIEILNERGENLEQVDECGNTLLHIAAQSGHITLVDYLLTELETLHHQDLEKTREFVCKANVERRTALHAAILAKKTIVIDWLLDQEETRAKLLSTSCALGKTALHYAVETRQDELIDKLIALGSDVNHQDSKGFTILHKAVQQHNWRLVDRLLSVKGLNLELKSSEDKTALDYIEEHKNLYQAASEGDLVWIKRLLALGADINKQYEEHGEKTALHAAILAGYSEVALYIIQEANPDLEVASEEDRTALHYASQKGNSVVVKALITKGANVVFKDGLDKTPRDLALAEGHAAVCAHLKKQMRLVQSRQDGSSSGPHLSGEAGPRSLVVPEAGGPADRSVSPSPEVRPDGTVGISLTIDYRELRYGLPIGQGGFGKVIRGEWRGKEVAIKELLLQSLSPKAVKSLTEEAAKMVQIGIRDPDAKIIRLYGICTEPTHFGIVMELMPKGSLFDLLRSQGQDIPWNTRWNIASDVAHGLALIHREGMLHRDLKSLNVLLDDRLRAKISDFGLSEVKNETRTVSSASRPSVGTLRWMAPEVLGLRPKYSDKSDVYGYGMVLWEIAACQLPYEGVEDMVVRAEVKSGEREEIPEDIPQQFAELITSCWTHKPAKRPTSDQIALSLEALSKQGVFAVGSGGAGAGAAGVSIEPASGVGGYSPL